ncbi:MAG: hypothetical protein U0892_21845 [Pirellulales bacterium]
MSGNKPLLFRGLALVCSLIVVVGGVARLYRGLTASGGATIEPKVTQILEESDAAVQEANRLKTEALSEFQTLLADFDGMEVATFRSEKQAASSELIAKFTMAGDRLKLAAAKLHEAIKIGVDKKTDSYLAAQARADELIAQVVMRNVEILQTLLDPANTDKQAITAQVLAIAAQREVTNKSADEAAEEATSILKQS